MSDETPELTIETVTATPVEELTDDHKTFLQEHAEELSDEQKETFKSVLTKEEKKEEIIDPDKIEIEERNKAKEIKEDKPTEDDPEVDPDDEKAISKVVDRKLKAVQEQLKEVQALRDEAEVTAFIQAKPEFSKYKGAMLKYLAHPTYKNIPVHNIAAIVASKELQQLGAQKEREAQKKVAETKDKGSTVRQPVGKVDWHTASKEDYQAQRARVFGHS